jgi:hypothetical protein
MALLFGAQASGPALSEAPSVEIAFHSNDAALDPVIEQCLGTEGVSFFEDTQTICYNDAIFPDKFLKLADMPEADQIIISSPGGNVATARIMSRILDERGEPVVIAGQCMSACAMVLLPGVDDLRIDNTAHIAVHGIAMMNYSDWFGWLKNGAKPGASDTMIAGLGYNIPYTMHKSGKDHMEDHLAGQNVEQDYIDAVSDAMMSDARDHPCRVQPNQYWGMLDAAHLQIYLGDRITHMERFIQSWDDPANNIYKAVTTPIASKTYIFDDDYETCG